METISRIDQIRKSNEAALNTPNHPTHTVKPWRNGELILPKISINSQFLKYRIENSRTIIQQLSYLRNNPQLPKNIFSDPESNAAQNAQEQILLSMVLPKKDFLKDLQDRKQDVPAIITYDGYIVNGNRRTAALKHLGVQYIICVVLPEDATRQEIYELEQALQIAKEFKEPYHWINELENFRMGIIDYNLKKEHLARRLGLSPSEFDAKLRMLDLIDSFLSWKGISRQYDYEKISDTEQIFGDLERALRSRKFKRDIKNQEELKKAVFGLIENRSQDGRLYQTVKDLIKRFESIKVKMGRTKHNLIVSTPHDTKTPEDIDIFEDPFKEIAAQSTPNESEDIVLDGFNTPESSSSATDSLLEVIADLKAIEKETDYQEAVYKSVSNALRELQGLTVKKDSTMLEDSKAKLIEIRAKTDELIEQIEEILNT